MASASIYVLFSGDKTDKITGEETSASERLNQNEKDKNNSADADDAEDLEVIKRLLADELKSHANTPEFQTETSGDQQFLFSRDFVLKVTRLTHKYHTIIHHVMKKQAEDRRLAAIEAEDDLEYTRAFYLQDIQKMRMATEIEDIIFDYFGIIET